MIKASGLISQSSEQIESTVTFEVTVNTACVVVLYEFLTKLLKLYYKITENITVVNFQVGEKVFISNCFHLLGNLQQYHFICHQQYHSNRFYRIKLLFLFGRVKLTTKNLNLKILYKNFVLDRFSSHPV